MLTNIIDSFVSYIQNNLTGFDTNNCKGYDDESVIDYVLRTDMSPNPQQACIVSYGGASQSKEMSEFGGLVVDWIIIVSALFPIAGDNDDVQNQKENAYAFLDTIMAAVINDSTLGSEVMDCTFLDSEPLMEYNRNGANTFLLLSVRFNIMENL